MNDNRFDYYSGAEGDQFSFIRIPKLMLLDPKFKDLSLGSIVLYGLLLDRMNISIKHGWLDENNHVYIRYKIRDIQETLNLSENTATKYLSELEKIGLVEKVKVGMGQGNVLFVKNFISPDLKDKALITTKNCGNGENDYYSKKLGKSQKHQNHDSDTSYKASKINIPANIGGYETSGFGGNETSENMGYETVINEAQSKKDINNTNNIKNLSNLSSSDQFLSIYRRRLHRKFDDERIDKMDISMIFRVGIREQIEYDALCNDQPDDVFQIDELIETMVEMMMCSAPSQQISGSYYSAELVKQRILKTYRKHIEYMLECLSKNTTKILNIKAYMRATIFNALSTFDSYYRAEVNHNEHGAKY